MRALRKSDSCFSFQCPLTHLVFFFCFSFFSFLFGSLFHTSNGKQMTLVSGSEKESAANRRGEKKREKANKKANKKARLSQSKHRKTTTTSKWKKMKKKNEPGKRKTSKRQSLEKRSDRYLIGEEMLKLVWRNGEAGAKNKWNHLQAIFICMGENANWTLPFAIVVSKVWLKKFVCIN